MRSGFRDWTSRFADLWCVLRGHRKPFAERTTYREGMAATYLVCRHGRPIGVARVFEGARFPMPRS